MKQELVPELRFPEFENAGEWAEESLGRVVKYENGKAHEQGITEFGDFTVVNSKFISTNGGVKKYTNEAFCLAKKGDILMVLSDVPNGKAIAKCFFVDSNNSYTVNQRICKLSPKKEAVGIMLFYSLNRSPYFLAFDDGVKQTNLRKDDVLNCPLLLPKDIKEQQKIADCLSSLDELITAHTQKHELLQSYKKGLMQNLFPAEGETVPALRFPEFRDKGDWVDEKFGDITNFNSGGTPSKDRAEYWDGDIPWISAASMHDISIEDSDRYITKLAVEDGARLASKGTLLLLVRGSMLHKRIPVGIAECEVAFNQDVKALRLKKPIFERFLLYFLISSEQRLLGAVTKTGIGAGKLDTNDLKDFKVSIPKNTDEQQKIADFLSSVDDLITEQAQKIEELKAHKKGLMQQLFPSPEGLK